MNKNLKIEYEVGKLLLKREENIRNSIVQPILKNQYKGKSELSRTQSTQLTSKKNTDQHSQKQVLEDFKNNLLQISTQQKNMQLKNYSLSDKNLENSQKQFQLKPLFKKMIYSKDKNGKILENVSQVHQNKDNIQNIPTVNEIFKSVYNQDYQIDTKDEKNLNKQQVVIVDEKKQEEQQKQQQENEVQQKKKVKLEKKLKRLRQLERLKQKIAQLQEMEKIIPLIRKQDGEIDEQKQQLLEDNLKDNQSSIQNTTLHSNFRKSDSDSVISLQDQEDDQDEEEENQQENQLQQTQTSQMNSKFNAQKIKLESIMEENQDYYEHLAGNCACGQCRCGKCMNKCIQQIRRPNYMDVKWVSDYQRNYNQCKLQDTQFQEQNNLKVVREPYIPKNEQTQEYISTQKNDYKKPSYNDYTIYNGHKRIPQTPFFGSSTYKHNFVDWEAKMGQVPYKVPQTIIDGIKLQGKSRTKEDYHFYEKVQKIKSEKPKDQSPLPRLAKFNDTNYKFNFHVQNVPKVQQSTKPQNYVNQIPGFKGQYTSLSAKDYIENDVHCDGVQKLQEAYQRKIEKYQNKLEREYKKICGNLNM